MIFNDISPFDFMRLVRYNTLGYKYYQKFTENNLKYIKHCYYQVLCIIIIITVCILFKNIAIQNKTSYIILCGIGCFLWLTLFLIKYAEINYLLHYENRISKLKAKLKGISTENFAIRLENLRFIKYLPIKYWDALSEFLIKSQLVDSILQNGQQDMMSGIMRKKLLENNMQSQKILYSEEIPVLANDSHYLLTDGQIHYIVEKPNKIYYIIGNRKFLKNKDQFYLENKRITRLPFTPKYFLELIGDSFFIDKKRLQEL